MGASFRFLDADDDERESSPADRNSPICGWVLASYLDDSLAVYDAEGNLIGQVARIITGQREAPRWNSAPGANKPPGAPPALQNRHLARFIKGLLALGRDTAAPLTELLYYLDETLRKTYLPSPPGGDSQVLMGSPLAVARAAVRLDVEDENVGLDSRVGDHGDIQNGVLGFFLDDDYDQFRPTYGFETHVGETRRARSYGYLKADPTFQLPAHGRTSRLTILVDPRGRIPLTAGLLPVQYLSLPPGPVATALERMSVGFHTGPILTDPSHVRLPPPSGVKGLWSWVKPSGVDDEPTWGWPPQIREGWLRLRRALDKTPPESEDDQKTSE